MRRKLFILSLFIISTISYSNIESLKLMLESGLITEEEYQIYTHDNIKKDGDLIYNLLINGEVKNRIYEVTIKNELAYFPVKSFFETINFKNYEMKDNIINARIGDSLKEVIFNANNHSMKVGDSYQVDENKIFVKNGDIYVEKAWFKEAFLKYINVNHDLHKINMTLSFATPEEINLRMKMTERTLNEKFNTNELLYTNDSKLFELGYLRLSASEVFTKNKKQNNKKYEKDWEGNLEYQGAFLYGQITSSYDLKLHTLDEVNYQYDEIYKNHRLEIGNYKAGDSGQREWEVSFKKDKGYYVVGDKNYVIKENVDIGSRVELIYLDTIIDIQTAVNGVVEFKRPEIKEDREYTLRIYTPEGKVYEKIINTTSNYNQQNKGEWEYDFSVRERHDIDRKTIVSNIYYGFTDKLTLGAGYSRTPELINSKYTYLDKGNTEIIYTSSLLSFPYTFKVGGEKVFNKEIYKNNLRKTEDDYSIDTLLQVDIKKLRLIMEEKKYGRFYENEKEQNFSAKYTLFNSLDVEYEYDRTVKYKTLFEPKATENKESLNLEYSKSIQNFLFTGEVNKYFGDNKMDKDEYGLNIYYTGFRSLTTRLENRWRNEGRDYEVAFSIFNNGNSYIDYSLEARYNEQDKDSLTFKFNINIDNWLKISSNFDKLGNQDHKIGIDRIIDLKNPLANIETMDSSRVKVITFVDLNNNNKLDVGEERVQNVEVNIGNKKVITDKNGEGIFYGIPNEIIYDLNPKIKKPNFLLGNNKIKIKGKNTSTITAYIPVKPMLTLTGIVNIDKRLNKSEVEKMKIYDDIFVQIKDLSGKVIDSSIPDNTGVFEISGLFPKQYFIEVHYVGIDYMIKGVNEIIQLSYVEEDKDGNKFILSIDDTEMKLGGKE